MESRENENFILDTEKYDKSPNIILANKELTATEKQLLIKIINLSEKTGYCFATQETLGNHLGKSKDTIKKAISSLKKKWYVRTESNGQKFNHNNLTYPIFEKIFNGKYADNLELKGTPKKDDFIPKSKQELIDSNREVYWYYQDNWIKSFENFWIHKREVVNLRRISWIYATRINEQYQDLFQWYVYDLGKEKIKEGRNITEADLQDISGTEYYYNDYTENESTYTEEDIEHFQEVWEIDSLPLLWLTKEEFYSNNIRQVILNKFLALDREKGKEIRKEKRATNEEIEKERQEFIEHSLKSYIYAIRNHKTYNVLPNEKRENYIKELQDLVDKIIKDIYDNYLIYNCYNNWNIKDYPEFMKLRTKINAEANELMKKKIKETKERNKLAKQEQEIQEKKEEIKELQRQKTTN